MIRPPVLLGAALLAGILSAWGLACSAAKEPEIGAEGSATGDAVAANAAARQEREDERAAAAAAGEGEEAPAAATSASRTPAVAVSDLPARDAEDDTVIVIERGGQEAAPTLAEAGRRARRERAESAQDTPSVASVTNENLHEYQDGQITFAKPAPEAASTAAVAAEGGTGAKAKGRGEAYWKGRVLDLRIALRDAVDELAELEGRAARLRTSFYAEDDPYVRDGRIKPAWDRTLDRIAALQKTLLATREQLTIALEEGRADGALPGWLREGLDLEPLPEELPPASSEDGIHQPGQPVILDEGREGPP